MTRQRCELSVATLVLAVAFVFAALSDAGSGRAGGTKEGGTFKISLPEGVFDYADPALSYGQPLLDLTCAHLMGYPDKPVPQGLRLVPEAVCAQHQVAYVDQPQDERERQASIPHPPRAPCLVAPHRT